MIDIIPYTMVRFSRMEMENHEILQLNKRYERQIKTNRTMEKKIIGKHVQDVVLDRKFLHK